MELLNAENVSLESIVVVERGKSLVNVVYKIVVNFGSNLIVERGRSNGIIVAANLRKRSSFTNHRVEDGGKGVAELTVGLIELSEC